MKTPPTNHEDLLTYEWYEVSALAPKCPVTHLTGLRSYWAFRATTDRRKVKVPGKEGHVIRNDTERLILMFGDASNEDEGTWDAVLSWPEQITPKIMVT